MPSDFFSFSWATEVLGMTDDERVQVEHLGRHTDPVGAGGVQWTLAEPSELNVNLVRLGPGSVVARHSSDVDVVLLALAGRATVRVGGQVVEISPLVLVHVPAGTPRTIEPADEGVTYLTVHRRRGPMTIGRRADVPAGAE